MRILVLNGSPKRDKSDAMHITRAFLDGMDEAARQEVHTIHVIDKHIEYCTGCFSCMRNGGTCVYEEDIRQLPEEQDTAIVNGGICAHGNRTADPGFHPGICISRKNNTGSGLPAGP